MCNGPQCKNEIKAERILFTPSSSEEYLFDIAFDAKNVPAASLKIPAGSILSKTSSILKIRPVAESLMRDVANDLHPSRWLDFQNQRELPFSQTVLSPAFHCSIGNATVALNMTFSATIDILQSLDVTNDVCLGYVQRFPSLGGYSRWVCVWSSVQARSQLPPVSRDALRRDQALGLIPDCGDSEDGKIFAFIHSPLPRPAELSVIVSKSWAEQNLLLLIILALFTTALIIVILFFLKRLNRYRAKYWAERAAVDKLQEEVLEMEEYGTSSGPVVCPIISVIVFV